MVDDANQREQGRAFSKYQSFPSPDPFPNREGEIIEKLDAVCGKAAHSIQFFVFTPQEGRISEEGGG
jgi:hypothetical protein